MLRSNIFRESSENFMANYRIKTGNGLVQEDEARLPGQRQRDSQFYLVSA